MAHIHDINTATVRQIFEDCVTNTPQTVKKVMRVNDTISVFFDEVPNVYKNTSDVLNDMDLYIAGIVRHDDADEEVIYLRLR